MNKILLIAFLILSLLACEKSNIEISELVAVDSLGWQESEEYDLGFISKIRIFDSKIYLIDARFSEIKVFDLDSFQYITKFGESGKAPSEFNFPSDICKIDSTYFVSDMNNFRVQQFDSSFNFVKSCKINLPFRLENYYDKLLVAKLQNTENPQILIYDEKEDLFNLFIDIHNLLIANNIDVSDLKDEVFRWSCNNDKIVISYRNFFKVFVIDIQSKDVIEIENQFMNLDDAYEFSTPKISENRITIVANSLEEESIEDKILILEYDLSGELLSVEKINGDYSLNPNLRNQSWICNNGFYYFFDNESNYLYKFGEL